MVSRNPSWVCSGHNITYNAERKPRAIINANFSFRQLTHVPMTPLCPTAPGRPTVGTAPQTQPPREKQSRFLPTRAVQHSEASEEAKLSILYQTNWGVFGVQGTMSGVHPFRWNKWLMDGCCQDLYSEDPKHLQMAINQEGHPSIQFSWFYMSYFLLQEPLVLFKKFILQRVYLFHPTPVLVETISTR